MSNVTFAYILCKACHKQYAVPSMEMMRKAMESGTLAVNEEQQWPENDDEIAKLYCLR